ncbi:MAG: hypothetical protein ABL308_11275 [Oceanicaulis sp.]
MSETPETPVKKSAGPVAYIVAFVWGLAAVTLLYSLWRTFEGGPDRASLTLLVIGLVCAAVGVVLSVAGSFKPKA